MGFWKQAFSFIGLGFSALLFFIAVTGFPSAPAVSIALFLVGLYILPSLQSWLSGRFTWWPRGWSRVGIAFILFLLAGALINDRQFEVPTYLQKLKPTQEQLAAIGPLYDVIQVVDGDTVKVDVKGEIVTLRLIGLNTPETVDPRKTVECFGTEASKKAHELLDGQRVALEYDASQGTVDKYGRSLAYVRTESGLFYNEYMIEQGFAYEYTYVTPYKYQAEFKLAQKRAEDEKRGLWQAGICKNSPPTPPQRGGEDASADKNCSDFSTQQIAQEYFVNQGGSKDTNVDGLDGDHDGLACEELK